MKRNTPTWLHVGAGVRALLICSLFYLGISTGNAMWATLTDEELVSSSALIVIGEWRGVSAGASGSIIVTEVLKGKAPPSLVLTQASGTGLKSSTDLVFRTGDRGLWLLRQAPGNTDLYFADHPQRFMPLPLNEERLRAIKRLIAR